MKDTFEVKSHDSVTRLDGPKTVYLLYRNGVAFGCYTTQRDAEEAKQRHESNPPKP